MYAVGRIDINGPFSMIQILKHHSNLTCHFLSIQTEVVFSHLNFLSRLNIAPLGYKLFYFYTCIYVFKKIKSLFLMFNQCIFRDLILQMSRLMIWLILGINLIFILKFKMFSLRHVKIHVLLNFENTWMS